MKIICDTNLPLGRTLFGTLGDVSLVDGTRLTREQVKDADLLMLRDTPLNAGLLEGTNVRMVGTAVTGTDHVDKVWMAKAGIRWVNAPRANGESVADYCVAALLEHAHMRHYELAGRTAAVIGCGWIGSMVRTRLETLGMRVICCDPPRKSNPRDSDAQSFMALEEVLPEADVLIPFVPLTDSGPYATKHMLNDFNIELVKYGALLINMSRGAVCDTQTVIDALRSGRLADAIIDVWETEPSFSNELADLAFLATPHLAGSSYEGKVNGTIAIYHAACSYLGKQPQLQPTLPPPIVPCIELDAAGKPDEELLWYATQKLSMIVADHMMFSEIFHLPEVVRKRRFMNLRRIYHYRRQFCATTVVLKRASPGLVEKFRGLGFKIQTA